MRFLFLGCPPQKLRSGYALQSFIPLHFIKGFPLLSLTRNTFVYLNVFCLNNFESFFSTPSVIYCSTIVSIAVDFSKRNSYLIFNWLKPKAIEPFFLLLSVRAESRTFKVWKFKIFLFFSIQAESRTFSNTIDVNIETHGIICSTLFIIFDKNNQ